MEIKYEKSAQKRVARDKLIYGRPLCPNIGKNETNILDNIEKEKGIKLVRQHRISHYFVDGYDVENNIVYEVDERYHLNQREKDLERENYIKNKLGCTFVRIKDE